MSVDVNYIYSCWSVAELLLEKKFFGASIKTLHSLCCSVNFVGLELLEVKSRTRLAMILNKYTANFDQSKTHLETASLILNKLLKESNISEEQQWELNFLRLNTFKLLSETYFHLSNPSQGRKLLINAIEFSEKVKSVSWNNYFRIELLKLLNFSRASPQEVLLQIEQNIKSLSMHGPVTVSTPKSPLFPILVIYNLIKLQKLSDKYAAAGTSAKVELTALQNQLNTCETLIKNLTGDQTLSKEDDYKNSQYWLENFSSMLLKIYFLLLKINFLISLNRMKECRPALQEIEPFCLLFVKKSKQINEMSIANKALNWLSNYPIIISMYLLGSVHRRSTGAVEKASDLIEKGLSIIEKRLDKIMNATNGGYTLQDSLNNETFVLLSYKFIFIFNKVLNYLGKGEFENAVKDIAVAKQGLEKNKFLFQKFKFHLQLLLALYYAIVGNEEEAEKHFSQIQENEESSNIQLKNWAKLFGLSVKLHQYVNLKVEKKKVEKEEVKKGEEEEKKIAEKKSVDVRLDLKKNEIFDSLDKYQTDIRFKETGGLTCALEFIRGSLCSESGLYKESDDYLRHGLFLSNRLGIDNSQYMSRVLVNLGKMYAKSNAATVAKKCFSSSLIRGNKTKDIVNQYYTLKLIDDELVEEGAEKNSKVKVLEKNLQERIEKSNKLMVSDLKNWKT